MVLTGKQLSDWARGQIKSLGNHPSTGGLIRVYRDLSERSGISESYIAKFTQAKKDNVTVATLDKLLAAIDAVHVDLNKAA